MVAYFVISLDLGHILMYFITRYTKNPLHRILKLYIKPDIIFVCLFNVCYKSENVYAYVDVILAVVDPGGGPSNKM